MQIDINNYCSITQFKDICFKIGLSKDLMDVLITNHNKTNFSKFNDDFSNIFTYETSATAINNIQSKIKNDENGLKAFVIYLVATIRTHELYGELGISDEIFISTMKMFSRFVNEHINSYGRYGFDRSFWINRILSLQLFRLGALEFEKYTFEKEIPKIKELNQNKKALSVHIPSDAKMSRENLDKSYSMAKSFFKQHFPEFDYSIVYCSTWLLSPKLKSFLNNKSRILEFQSDYKIIETDFEADTNMNWIFGKQYTKYEDLPEDTSLRRGVKRMLLKGDSIGTASGYIKNFDMKF